MKKQLFTVFLVLLLAVPFFTVSAQEISITMDDTLVYGEPGVVELVLAAEITNVSSSDQTVFLVRTINSLPENWTSSLCFDINCYPPTVDSVTTTESLAPGATIEASVHFFPDGTVPGTANVQIQIGTMHNPTARTTYNLVASTEPNAVNDGSQVIKEFEVYQNYPNPFNPSTRIKFGLAADSKVSIKIFNLLGQQVAELINGEYAAGRHEVNFNASALSSGIYFYVINAAGKDGSNFTSTKKMTLMK
jgi:hypothetical protein